MCIVFSDVLNFPGMQLSCISRVIYSLQNLPKSSLLPGKKLLLRHGAAWRVERGLNMWPHLTLAAG